MIFSALHPRHPLDPISLRWFGLKTHPYDFIGKIGLKLKKRANELLSHEEKAASELNNSPHRTKTIAENAWLDIIFLNTDSPPVFWSF